MTIVEIHLDQKICGDRDSVNSHTSRWEQMPTREELADLLAEEKIISDPKGVLCQAPFWPVPAKENSNNEPFLVDWGATHHDGLWSYLYLSAYEVAVQENEN